MIKEKPATARRPPQKDQVDTNGSVRTAQIQSSKLSKRGKAKITRKAIPSPLDAVDEYTEPRRSSRIEIQNKKIALMIDFRADVAGRAAKETPRGEDPQPRRSSRMETNEASRASIEQDMDVDMEPATASRKRKAEEELVTQCKARDQRQEQRQIRTNSNYIIYSTQLKDEAMRRDASKRKSSSKPVHKIKY